MTLDIDRLGHLNVFTDDYGSSIDRLSSVLGAVLEREASDDAHGVAFAVLRLPGVLIEVVSSSDPHAGPSKWVASHGPGWHSPAWVVTPWAACASAVDAAGLEIAGGNGENFWMIDEKDAGMTIQLSASDGLVDDADMANPLGLDGRIVIKVAAADPGEVASRVAALLGTTPSAVSDDALNSAGHRIAVGDHAVEFATSRTGSEVDYYGGQLRDTGPGIFCVSFGVVDLHAARRHLVEVGINFAQNGGRSVMLRKDDMGGCAVELLGP